VARTESLSQTLHLNREKANSAVKPKLYI